MRTHHCLLLVASLLLAACASEVSYDPGPPPPGGYTTRKLNTSLECGDFQRNADGSWSTVRETIVASLHGPYTVGPGRVFKPGESFMGVDVAAGLRQECS